LLAFNGGSAQKFEKLGWLDRALYIVGHQLYPKVANGGLSLYGRHPAAHRIRNPRVLLVHLSGASERSESVHLIENQFRSRSVVYGNQTQLHEFVDRCSVPDLTVR
jgi:hypothetical protein